jgi:hypothetical protein
MIEKWRVVVVVYQYPLYPSYSIYRGDEDLKTHEGHEAKKERRI